MEGNQRTQQNAHTHTHNLTDKYENKFKKKYHHWHHTCPLYETIERNKSRDMLSEISSVNSSCVLNTSNKVRLPSTVIFHIEIFIDLRQLLLIKRYVAHKKFLARTEQSFKGLHVEYYLKIWNLNRWAGTFGNNCRENSGSACGMSIWVKYI